MRIIIDELGQTNIYDEKGEDMVKLLCNHGIYLSDVTLRMSPAGASLQANIVSCRYVIETPNSLMSIVHALHSIEG